MSKAIKTVILILAAGASSRFGSPKALAPWGKGHLLSTAIATANEVSDGQSLVVLGRYADEIAPHLTGPYVVNANWAQGLGTSIATGAKAALGQRPDLETVIILPVDQPLVTARHLETLRATALCLRHCVFTRDGDDWGPPAAIPRDFFPLLIGLDGHDGIKSWIKNSDATFVDAPVLADVDTAKDLERLALSQRGHETA